MASLVGTRLPDVELQATNGTRINLAKLPGTIVVACYPFTGRPGHPNPPDWDHIPSAHGSTPQILAFSELYEEFVALNVKIFGVSFSTPEWQQDFSKRNALPFPLLSDENQNFANALQLDRFRAGPQNYLSRRSMIVEDAIIRHDLFPVPSPEDNAAQTLAALKQ